VPLESTFKIQSGVSIFEPSDNNINCVLVIEPTKSFVENVLKFVEFVSFKFDRR